MRFKNFLAAAAAAALTVTSVGGGTVLAEDSDTKTYEPLYTATSESGESLGTIYNLPDDCDCSNWISSVTKIVASIELSSSNDGVYLGGSMGVNISAEPWWSQKDFEYTESGSYDVELTPAAEVRTDNGFKFDINWLNGGNTVILNTIKFYDANDRVLYDAATGTTASDSDENNSSEDGSENEEQNPEEETPTDEPTTLWEEDPVDLGTDWSANVPISADEIDASENDVITIYFTVGAAEYQQIELDDGNWTKITTYATNDYGTIDLDATETSHSITLTADDAALISENGLIIKGYNITITSVTLTPASNNTNNSTNNSADGEEEGTTTTTTHIPYYPSTTTETTTAEDTTDKETSAPETTAAEETAAPEATTAAPASSDNNGGGTSGPDSNMNTGVAIALVPVIAAAAGLIVSKRKK